MKNVELNANGTINSPSAVVDLADQQRLKILAPRKWIKGPFMVSTDKALIDTNFVFTAMSKHSIDKRHIVLALRESLCFGLYRNDRQLGFARIVTDLAGTAVIRDIYITSEYRFIGMGSWLLSCCLTHPAMLSCGSVIGWGNESPAFLMKNGFKPVENVPEMYIVRKPSQRASGQLASVH